MKNIQTKLNEALRDNDKSIIDLLKAFSHLCDGVQGELYKQKLKDADSVDISPISEVLTDKEIKEIKKRRLQKKECYRNAFVTCEALEFNHEEVKYVEGYYNMQGLPIEHAFVKVDGKYIDPTMELVLKNVSDKDTYVKLGEFNINEVREIIVENGFWGQIYDYTFIKKYKENISK